MNVPSLLFGFVVNFLLPLVLYLMATGRTTALAGREHDERARNGAELHDREGVVNGDASTGRKLTNVITTEATPQ